MRRLAALLLAGATLSAAPASAQMDQYLELLRQDMRTEKVAVFTEAMALTDADAEKFWPIYRDYDHARTALGDQELQLIRDYAAAFDTMDDVKAKDILARAMKIDDDVTKLQRKTIKQMEKALGPIVAARFYQVDNQVHRLISLQIGANLPLIEKAPAAMPASDDPHAGHGH
jgi:hypothetical protein